MEAVWAGRSKPGFLDAILAAMVGDLGYFFEVRGLWQLGDRWNDRAILLLREAAPARMRMRSLMRYSDAPVCLETVISRMTP